MNAIGWVTLNPEKKDIFRFVAKGINLTHKNPVGLIPANLDGEMLMPVNRALREGILLSIDNSGSNPIIKKKMSGISEEVEKTATITWSRDASGKLSMVVDCPDDDGNVDTENPKIITPKVVMGDIVCEELED